MASIDRETAARLALQRGLISPDKARAMGFGHLADQAASGQLAAGGAAMRDTARDQQFLIEQRNLAKQQAEMSRLASEFLEINKRTPTGQMWSIPGLGAARGAFDPDVARMNSITNYMAPRQRVPGSGASSDRDVNLYLSAVPNQDFLGSANTEIVKNINREAERQQKYVSFLEDWYAKNGTLLGAEAEWSRKSNPKRTYNPKTGKIE